MMDADGLSPKQLLSLQEASARINIWEGAVRSGKTIGSLLRWLMYVAACTVPGELVVVSRTRDSAARNVFAPLMNPDLFGAASEFVDYTAGAPSGTILGRRVWVLGSSDTRSENVLRGLTCAGAYVDEVTLLREDFFTQLLNRLWEGAKLFGTTNPDNPAHWLKRKFLDRLHELPDWKTWKFLLDDNPMLSEERKAGYRRENTGLYYRRNILGEWVAAEGSVFSMWDPDKHVVPWERLPQMTRLLGCGVDFGTRNASSGLVLGLGADSRLYLVDEWRYDAASHCGERLSSTAQADRLVTFLGQPHTPQQVQPRIEWVFHDPAAADFGIQLFQRGLSNLQKAENEVLYGIRLFVSLLDRGQLLVADRCRGLITEMPGYSWDDKAAEKGVDKPIKTADHSIDGARYAIATTESMWSGLLAEPELEAA